jgi:nicotinamide mononucleotide transporter
MSKLEIIANIFNLICVFLAARNQVTTWPTGIVASILFGWMFFDVKLYADVSLQIFFILTSLYGWWSWKKNSNQKELAITKVQAPLLLKLGGLGVLTTISYGTLLHATTDASFPFIDSIVLMFSVIAQFLLMKRKLENWIFWIIVNTVAVPLYAAKELYLTSFIYAIFWVNAIMGYRKWLSILKATE